MKTLNNLKPYAHWFLRIALVSVFLYHGLNKFPKLNDLAQMMNMPVLAVAMLAMMETVGALLLLLGGFSREWMTRVGALLLLPVMLGAIFMIHWGQWNFAPSQTHPMGGIEFQFTLVMIQLYFLIVGNNVNPEKVEGL